MGNTDKLTSNMKLALTKLSDKKYKTAKEIGVQLNVLHSLKNRKLIESQTIHTGFPNVRVEIRWRRLPNVIDNAWIKDFKEFIGKKTFVFNFKEFMKDKNITVEELSKIVGYTFDGTIKMLNRGTIKLSTLSKIRIIYPQIDNYKKIIK